MGKFQRDYSGVDRTKSGQEYTGDVPKPGIYDAELFKLSDHVTENSPDGQEWIFHITEEPYAGWAGWVYTNGSSAAWKEVQILEALGIMAPGKDAIATTQEKIVAKAGPCRVKVRNELYDDEKRGKITTVLPPRDEEDGSTKKKKGKKKKAQDDEDPF